MMKKIVPALALATATLLGGCGETEVSFKDDVHPILKDHCLKCHVPGGEGYEKSGLLMDTHANLMKGTNHGPIVIAGDPLTSVLNQVVEGRVAKPIRMPHGGKQLPKAQQETLNKWVAQGAKNN